MGYRHGFQGTDYKGFFWAEKVEGWGYGEYRISSPAPGPVGYSHNFKIEHFADTPEGRRLFRVYIDFQCVVAHERVPCESNQPQWIQEHDVGGEATADDAMIGPTHVSTIWNRPQGSSTWIDWSPNGRLVSEKAPNQPVGLFEWYGDYRRALYGQRIQFFDHFERSGRDDFPGWTLFEDGGDIFIHYIGPDPENPIRSWSHVHANYWNAQSYLLMRRSRADSSTASPIVVEFGFGEDLANPAGRFFGVWSSGDSTQMGLGVKTDFDANKYFYRVGNQFYNTGIARTDVWHIFRFYIRTSGEGCSYGELDGTSLASLATNCDLTPSNLSTWGIASTWGLTDPPDSDAIWDNAVYFHH